MSILIAVRYVRARAALFFPSHTRPLFICAPLFMQRGSLSLSLLFRPDLYTTLLVNQVSRIAHFLVRRRILDCGHAYVYRVISFVFFIYRESHYATGRGDVFGLQGEKCAGLSGVIVRVS